jgi:FkbM family methyltransferase
VTDLTELSLKGFTLFIRSGSESDSFVIEEIWKDLDSYKINDKKKDVVLDIGGNIGLFSLFIANQNTNAKIVAYEPEDENYEIFSKNITKNKLNIDLVKKAVSDVNGVIYLDANHGLTTTNKAAGSQSVQCININDLIKEHDLNHIDILKMDVEGAEYEIFSVIEDEILKSIDYITMELHYETPELLDSLLSILGKYHDVNYEQQDFEPIRGGMIYASRR